MPPEEIQRLARNERVAGQVGFWWGLAEGLFFFIVPDVYISFASLFSLRAGALAWVFSIVGSATAAVAIYLLTTTAGLDYMSFLEAIPGISRSMIERVQSGLAAQGLPYTPLLMLGGVPFKVYAGAAFAIGLSPGSLLVWTVFARIVRIAPMFAVVAILRLLFRQRIDARPSVWAALLGLSWLGFYIVYFQRLSRP
jgi:hypothetical protein